jgi:hypothetical protein
MHPTDAQLEAYIARSLDRPARRDLDHHLESCFRCTLRLEFAAAQPHRWKRQGLLGRLVSVPPAPAAPAATRQAPVREAA